MAIREVRDALVLRTGQGMKGYVPDPDHPDPDPDESTRRAVIFRDFEMWTQHLDSWLAYILSSKVKQGQKQVPGTSMYSTVRNSTEQYALEVSCLCNIYIYTYIHIYIYTYIHILHYLGLPHSL